MNLHVTHRTMKRGVEIFHDATPADWRNEKREHMQPMQPMQSDEHTVFFFFRNDSSSEANEELELPNRFNTTPNTIIPDYQPTRINKVSNLFLKGISIWKLRC